MTLAEAQKNIILREEAEFPRLFAHAHETDYGVLFHQQSNADCNDANHAILCPQKISNLGAVLDDIRDFYLTKGLVPLIYPPYVPGYIEENHVVFAQHGWKFVLYDNEYEESRMMVLTEPSVINVPRRLEIRRLHEWDNNIAAAFGKQPNEPYLQVNRDCLRHENFYCFVGYLNGVPVTHTSLYVSPLGCTHFLDFETAEQQRGQGYGREIIHFVTEFCRVQGFPLCYQWPANATSERITTEAGFRVVFTCPGNVRAEYKGEA